MLVDPTIHAQDAVFVRTVGRLDRVASRGVQGRRAGCCGADSVARTPCIGGLARFVVGGTPAGHAQRNASPRCNRPGLIMGTRDLEVGSAARRAGMGSPRADRAIQDTRSRTTLLYLGHARIGPIARESVCLATLQLGWVLRNAASFAYVRKRYLKGWHRYGAAGHIRAPFLYLRIWRRSWGASQKQRAQLMSL